MAAFTSTTTVSTISGRRHYRVVISETATEATSEWNVENLPSVGTITLFQASITSGSGTTLTPRLGKVTSFAAGSVDVIATQASAQSSVHDTTPIRYSAPTNTIFGVSGVNTGSDSAISTVIEIVEGHVL